MNMFLFVIFLEDNNPRIAWEHVLETAMTLFLITDVYFLAYPPSQTREKKSSVSSLLVRTPIISWDPQSLEIIYSYSPRRGTTSYHHYTVRGIIQYNIMALFRDMNIQSGTTAGSVKTYLCSHSSSLVFKIIPLSQLLFYN